MFFRLKFSILKKRMKFFHLRKYNVWQHNVENSEKIVAFILIFGGNHRQLSWFYEKRNCFKYEVLSSKLENIRINRKYPPIHHSPPPLQKKAFNFFQAPMLLLTYFSQNFTSDEFNTGCDLEADHINTVDRIFSTLKLG